MSENILDLYDYSYPKSLIANHPATPRDTARLLVYNRKTQNIKHDSFKNLGNYLLPNSVLVFNETKVIPARFTLKKPTGGQVELLYLSHNPKSFFALSNRSLNKDTILTTDSLEFRVVQKLTKGYEFSVNLTIPKFLKWLDVHGKTPLPPYIKNSPLTEKKLQQEYQTIFAKNPGSAAAPTASLHFTKRLLSSLKKQGIKTETITLHVGLGTFAPVTEDNLLNKTLHSEYYEISNTTATKLNKYKQLNYPIIAVGTTVVRTLESAVDSKGNLTKLSGNTNLFIQEDYKFKFVDNLITNFHVPKSSLMMLVSSLTTREELLRIYEEAVKKKYRLFSFGDGMFIN